MKLKIFGRNKKRDRARAAIGAPYTLTVLYDYSPPDTGSDSARCHFHGYSGTPTSIGSSGGSDTGGCSSE